jgi:hypothetical protein
MRSDPARLASRRGTGWDFSLVDVVDRDVDADFLLLHEWVEPLVVCRHEVAP